MHFIVNMMLKAVRVNVFITFRDFEIFKWVSFRSFMLNGLVATLGTYCMIFLLIKFQHVYEVEWLCVLAVLVEDFKSYFECD